MVQDDGHPRDILSELLVSNNHRLQDYPEDVVPTGEMIAKLTGSLIISFHLDSLRTISF